MSGRGKKSNRATIQRLSNTSIGVPLPPVLLDAVGFFLGDKVKFTISNPGCDDVGLIIQKVKKKKKVKK